MNYFKPELLDPDKLVQANELKEIINPIIFSRDNIPSSDGLLSNEIFGIIKDDRANIFGYIDLQGYFMNPLVYKMWSRLDRRIKSIVYGSQTYKIVGGDFVEDENGETGIDFIRKNIDKIKIKSTDSDKRDKKIAFIEKAKKENLIFMNKCIISPAFYRDVNTNTKGYVGVGDINKLYISLLLSVKSIRELSDYGLNLSHTVMGRIQEILVNIYNWYTNGVIDGQSVGNGLASKTGIIRSSVLSKTSDYASRLVLSAPSVDVERYTDLEVDLDYSAIPLSSICVNLYPFMLFNMRRFFEYEFTGYRYPYKDKKTGEIKYLTVKDPQIEFSDTRLKSELDRFIRGYSNRFIPIQIPNEEGKLVYMKFRGKHTSKFEDSEASTIVNRRLTWCDVIYMAAVEAVKGKHVLVTRYPVDDYFGQSPLKIRVSSTIETEPVMIDTEFYPKYPKIREEDIGSDTSNKFVDTMKISNLLLAGNGGDYDGDQVTNKVAFSEEANEELDKIMNSKANYITIGGENIKVSSGEALHAIYCLTRARNKEIKLTDPTF